MNFNKKISLHVLLIIGWLTIPCFSQVQEGYEKGLEYINKSDIKNSITFLASDELKGRATGSEENLEAARFIAKKFSEFGLLPYNEGKITSHLNEDEDDETDLPKPIQQVKPEHYDRYFQKFNLTSSKIDGDKTRLILTKKNNGSEQSFNYKLKKDFTVNYKSHRGISIEAPLVFVGYGIDKGEKVYNDYLTRDDKEIDVKNKVVLMIESYPQENNPESDFSKSKNVLYKSVRKKAEVALSKGAIAVLVAQSPLKQNPPFAVKFENFSTAFLKSEFGLPESKNKESIPLLYISNDVVKDLFSSQKESLTKLLSEIDKALTPNAFNIEDSKFKIEIDLDVDLIPAYNVVGFLEGTDPNLKNEYLVFGAHYDHVGLGNYGAMDKKNKGQIHNGADDNASGTSGLIELAEAFSKNRPKRSLIFVAFSGEENGILGSRYYVTQNPYKEIENTVAMINLDMIGRNEPQLVWVGGPFYSDDIKKVVQEANVQIGFELLFNVGLLNFASDQGPYIRSKVPSLFFFSGLHDDYHMPSDDVDKINFDKAERITKLAYLSGWVLANQNEKPKYREATMDEKIILVKESLERQRKYRPEENKEKN